jgi:hypothetical protein
MADETNDIHGQVLAILLEKVEADPYPSATMLDLIEQMLRPDEVEAYAEILLDKIRGDRFPSLDMLSRVRAFA